MKNGIFHTGNCAFRALMPEFRQSRKQHNIPVRKKRGINTNIYLFFFSNFCDRGSIMKSNAFVGRTFQFAKSMEIGVKSFTE